MQLVSEDPSIDIDELNRRLQDLKMVLQSMQLGLITADNFTWDDRWVVQNALRHQPVVQAINPSIGLARYLGEKNLVEGQDWCFATNIRNEFNIYSLDEPARTFLQGAIFHLWEPDTDIRHDYFDLNDYQTQALEMALSVAA